MAECDPPARLRAEIDDLLAKKAITRELGSAPLSPEVATFIDSEFEAARAVFEVTRIRPAPETLDCAECFYRGVVERLEKDVG